MHAENRRTNQRRTGCDGIPFLPTKGGSSMTTKEKKELAALHKKVMRGTATRKQVLRAIDLRIKDNKAAA